MQECRPQDIHRDSAIPSAGAVVPATTSWQCACISSILDADPRPVDLESGGYLTADVDQIGSGTAGSNLVGVVLLDRVVAGETPDLDPPS